MEQEVLNIIQQEIQTNYSYLNLIEEDLNFLLKEINKSNNIANYSKKDLINTLKINIKKYVLAEFNFDGSKQFLNNYINGLTLEKDSLSFIKKIVYLFNQLEIDPNIDFILNIIETNKNLRLSLKSIVDKNMDKVKSDNINEIYDDNIFIQFIEGYSILNDITSDEELEIFIESAENISPEKQYLIEIKKIPLLTQEEEQKLFIQLSKGDKSAKEKLIKHNLRLVLKLANKYSNPKYPTMDLFSEGSIGLMKAIDYFDYQKGFKFSTYAVWWIRQAINRAIAEKSDAIRLPVHLYEKKSKFWSAYYSFIENNNRQPTAEEMANDLGFTISSIKYIMSLPDVSTSLNKTINDDESTEFGETLDNNDMSLQEIVENLNLNENVAKLLTNHLTRRELKIIVYRMGLDGNGERTLESIGKMFGLTRERIRQIEAKALTKLRRNRFTKEFAIYMDNPDKALENIRPIYKNEDKIIEKSEKIKKRTYKSLDNLRDYYGEYTDEQFYAMLELLPNEYKTILNKIYDQNFTKKEKCNLTEKEYACFHRSIKRKMNNLIKSIKLGVISTPKNSVKKSLEMLMEYINQSIELKNIYTEFNKLSFNPKVKTEEIVNKLNIINKVKDNLQKLGLNNQEINVLIYSIGLDGKGEKTYAETARLAGFKYSSWVPSIEEKAFNKLRQINTIIKSSNEKTYKSWDNLRNLYNEYTDEQFDLMIELLPEKAKKIVFKRYGKNLKNPVLNKISRSEQLYLHSTIKTKMNNILKDIVDGKVLRPKDDLIKSLEIILNLTNESEQLTKIINELKNNNNEKINLEELALKLNICNVIKKHLEIYNLKEKEINVLIYRMGLDGKGKRSVTIISNTLNIIRNRVYVLEKSAIKKIEKYKNKNTKKKEETKMEENKKEKLIEIENSPKEKKKRICKSMDNLREYYNEYTDEQFDSMIKLLPDNYKMILQKKYTNNYKNIVQKSLSKEESTLFYGSIRPKMTNLLKNIANGKICINKNYDNQTNISEKHNVECEELTTEYHSKILEIFNLPEFIELTKTMPIKDSIIVSLRLGYIEGKCFSTKSIANFFGFNQEDVIKISQNGIGILKNKLNNMIDEEIDKIDSKIVYQKVPNNEKK